MNNPDQFLINAFKFDENLVKKLLDLKSYDEILVIKANLLSKLPPVDYMLLKGMLKEVERANKDNARVSMTSAARHAGKKANYLRSRLIMESSFLRQAFTVCALTSPITKGEYYFHVRLALKRALEEGQTNIAQKLITDMGKAANVFNETQTKDKNQDKILNIDEKVRQALLQMGAENKITLEDEDKE